MGRILGRSLSAILSLLRDVVHGVLCDSTGFAQAANQRTLKVTVRGYDSRSADVLAMPASTACEASP